MNNRQELDKLVMTDPLAYAVYNKSKIENQSFEVFLINLAITQHDRLKDLEKQVIDDEELLVNKTSEIVELESKVKKLQVLKAKADEMANTINAYGEYPWMAHEYLEAAKEVDNG